MDLYGGFIVLMSYQSEKLSVFNHFTGNLINYTTKFVLLILKYSLVLRPNCLFSATGTIWGSEATELT